MLRVIVEKEIDAFDLREKEELSIESYIDPLTSSDLSFDDFGGLTDVVARARELIEIQLQNAIC